jgi:small GTP-binding protein
MSQVSPAPPKKYSLKVILVGSAGVGKTSLISTYFNNPFDAESLATVAPASCSATIRLDESVHVELQLWDTAGQERFQSISKMFYRDSNVALICFDATTIDTIDSWVGRVRAEVPDCILFLVATKSDMLTDEQTAKCLDVGSDKQLEFGAQAVVLTSAITADGVKELFVAVAKCAAQVYVPNQPDVELSAVREQSKAQTCC